MPKKRSKLLFWLAIALLLAYTEVYGSSAAIVVLYSSTTDSLNQRDFRNFRQESSNETAELLFHDLNSLTTPVMNNSCDEQEALSIQAIVEELFIRRTNVTAVVGPSCTDSAFAITKLINRGELSIPHLYTSPLSATLSSQLSNTFGVLGPIELLAEAGVALIQHAGWSQVISFHQDTNTDMKFIFNHFRKSIADSQSTTVEYISSVNGGDNHLADALSRHAIRVIYLMLDATLTREVLCQGYHYRAFYPDYQWVVLHTTLHDILHSAESVQTSTGEVCDRMALQAVLEHSILIGHYISGTDIQHGVASEAYNNALKMLYKGLSLSTNAELTISESLNQLEATIDRRAHLI